MTSVTHLDPVCGMPVSEDGGLRLSDTSGDLWFCSEFCRQQFLRHPHAYEPAAVPVPVPVDWVGRRVAYLSMEVALANDIPTYAGGLGVLAGDILRSCADLQVPVDMLSPTSAATKLGASFRPSPTMATTYP